MITIVLADNENLVRRGIRCLIERHEEFKVIGETADGLKVVPLIARLNPRVLIVGVAMPGLNGLEITRLVRQQSLATAVILLSRHAVDDYVLQALRNGASGYVVKWAKPAELARAIRTAARGRHYLSAPFSERPIARWLDRAQRESPDAFEMLTPREREVLRLIAEGHSNEEIAGRLSISRRTAESHRASIMRKLNLRNLLELIRYVLSRHVLIASG